MADLVIFDCDGVLVDSEVISVAVLVEAITEAGGSISTEHAFSRFLGRSMASVVAMLGDEFGVQFTEAHGERLRAALYERFRRELKPILGIGQALDRLPGRVCVASSSSPERVRLSLGITGLLARFEPNIYSASMVSHGKPAPDLFLFAARSMDVAAADCVVIEDSPVGVAAARAAGMRVFGFAGGSHGAPAGLRSSLAETKPDLIFDDMAQLPALLAQATTRAIRRA